MGDEDGRHSEALHEELQALRRRYDELVQVIGRELNMPFNSIAGFAELLRRDECSEEDHREFAGFIVEDCATITRILQDFRELWQERYRARERGS